MAGWDLKLVKDALTFFVEVKKDIKSCVTGNLALEFYNPKNNEKSGILASIADFWIYIIPNKGVQEIWLTTLKEIFEFINHTSPHKIIDVGGDKNASLYLYRKETILGPLFTKLNNLSEYEILWMLKKYDESRQQNNDSLNSEID